MRQLLGKIISNKMSKTVVVEVERMVKHPLYQKIMRRTKKYKVATGELTLNIGDRVKIVSVRPLSKDKHYRVVSKI